MFSFLLVIPVEGRAPASPSGPGWLEFDREHQGQTPGVRTNGSAGTLLCRGYAGTPRPGIEGGAPALSEVEWRSPPVGPVAYRPITLRYLRIKTS